MRNERGNVGASKTMRESRLVQGDFTGLSRAHADVLVVAVGGVDPTGGAGVVRDLLTARTLNARVRVIPTAWTEQSAAGGVSSVEPRAPAALEAAVDTALAVGRDQPDLVVVVKVGMLPHAAAADAVLRALRNFEGPVVFDPVLGASSGGSLYRGDPTELLAMGARATVFMPNATEAARLSKREVVDPRGAEEAGIALIRAGVSVVLVKGGHLAGDLAVDLLVSAGGVRRFEAPRLPGPSVRGTGCALGTAVAVALGRGLSLEQAVGEAKAWLHGAIAGAIAVGDERHLS
jgi:hydroxymethylpyrimidine/phosphomethylpyrimidine kinase